MSNTINLQRTKQPNICPDCLAKGTDSCTPSHSDIITFSAKTGFSTEEAKKNYETEHDMSHPFGYVHWHNLQFNINSVPKLIQKNLKDYDGAEIHLKSDDPFNGEQVEIAAIDALLDADACMDFIRNELIKKNYLITCVSIASHILQSENILNENYYKTIHDGTSLMQFCLEESLKKLSLKIELDSADSTMFTILLLDEASTNVQILNQYPIILPKKQSFFDFFVGENTFNIATKDKQSLHTNIDRKLLMLRQIVKTLELTINNFGHFLSLNTTDYIKVIESIYRHLEAAKPNQVMH